MNSDQGRDAKRERAYLKHALDEGGRHLPGQCPECERIEGLEADAAALKHAKGNLTAFFDSLKTLLEKHGCPYCLDCATAGFLIKYVEHFLETGTFIEPGYDDLPISIFPDPHFEKIVAPNGYPVAQFYSKERGEHFVISKETLAGIVERAEAEGRNPGEHGRALKALDAAIQEWAQTPWDGK